MKEKGLVFGQKCIVSLARYDQDTRSLRMYQCSLFGEEQELLQILPKSGTIVNGKLSEQTKWELGIEEKESGSWPTPTTKGYGHASEGQTLMIRKKVEQGIITESEGQQMLGGTTLRPPRMKKWNFPTPTTADTWTDKLKSSQQKEGSMHSVNLSQAVHMKEMFPTPMAQEPGNTKKTYGKKKKKRGGFGLTQTVKMFPTPTTEAAHHRNTIPPSIGKTRGYDLTMKIHELEKQKMFPTPTSSNHKGWLKGHKRAEDPTNRLDFAVEPDKGVGGTLNSEWVEWLMGFPVGWTEVIGVENQKESPELKQDKQKE